MQLHNTLIYISQITVQLNPFRFYNFFFFKKKGYSLIEVMICKKYKTFNLCFIFILSYLFFRVEPFTPEERMAHSSILVGDKLYFFGGFSTGSCSNEIFYLDVSKSFYSSTPTWIDLTQDAGIPFKSCWETISLNDKEQTIYLFGGIMKDLTTNTDAFTSNVHSFNLNSLKWDVPDIKGVAPKRRRNIKSVIDDTGKMYIFGGYADEFLGSPLTTFFSDMVILNTADVELSWSISTPINASRRDLYTATLLSNGVIIYIGGYGNETVSEAADIKVINLYDTKSQTWSVKVRINFNLYFINYSLLNQNHI